MKRKDRPNTRDTRPNKVCITLSDRELAAIDDYCATFGKKSRSAVIREGAIRFAMQRLIERRSQLFTLEETEQMIADAACETPVPYRRSPSTDLTPSLFDIDFDEENEENEEN